jgi:hypothetical protein
MQENLTKKFMKLLLNSDGLIEMKNLKGALRKKLLLLILDQSEKQLMEQKKKLQLILFLKQNEKIGIIIQDKRS